jgi:hypothetical protein
MKHGRGNGESGANIGSVAAQAMLDAFISVGTTDFDVTWTNAAGDKERFRRDVSASELSRTMASLLDDAIHRQRNLIVRPHGPGISFVQLDDLKANQLPPLAASAFLALETSPGNFQAWIALAGSEDKDFARRLRKGTGADATASGATRIAGSVNFKDKYAPNFPRVQIRAAHPGRLAQPEELEQLGLVAAPEVVAQPLRISPPVFPKAAIAGGRVTPAASMARRSTAKRPAPTSAGRISCSV